jgi:hypothetical protein
MRGSHRCIESMRWSCSDSRLAVRRRATGCWRTVRVAVAHLSSGPAGHWERPTIAGWIRWLPMPIDSPRKVPDEVVGFLDSWNRHARLTRALVIGLGITAVVASVLVSAGVGGKADAPTSWLAIVAAITTAGSTFLSIRGKSNNMRSAWRILSRASLEYQYSDQPDEPSLVKLLDAYAEAEAVIGDIEI